MSVIPCKNCITLSMCKAQSYEYLRLYVVRPELSRLHFIYEGVLIKKCSLILEWMEYEYNKIGGGYEHDHRLRFHRFVFLKLKHEFKGCIYNERNALY